MRTTIDLADPLSVERELGAGAPREKRRARLPLIQAKEPGVLKLSNAQIDEILLG